MRLLLAVAVLLGSELGTAEAQFPPLPPGHPPAPAPGSQYDIALDGLTFAGILAEFPGWSPESLANILYHALAACGKTLANAEGVFSITQFPDLVGGLYGLVTYPFGGSSEILFSPELFLMNYFDVKREDLDWAKLNDPEVQASLFLALVHELQHECRQESDGYQNTVNPDRACEELAAHNADQAVACKGIKAVACAIEKKDEEITDKQAEIDAKQEEVDNSTDPGEKALLEDELAELEQELLDLEAERDALEADRQALCAAVDKANDKLENPPKKSEQVDWPRKLADCLAKAAQVPPEGFVEDTDCPLVTLPPSPASGEPIFKSCPCCEGGDEECGGGCPE